MAWAMVRKTEAVIWLGFLFKSLIRASNAPERWETRLKPVMPARVAREEMEPSKSFSSLNCSLVLLLLINALTRSRNSAWICGTRLRKSWRISMRKSGPAAAGVSTGAPGADWAGGNRAGSGSCESDMRSSWADFSFELAKVGRVGDLKGAGAVLPKKAGLAGAAGAAAAGGRPPSLGRKTGGWVTLPWREANPGPP